MSLRAKRDFTPSPLQDRTIFDEITFAPSGGVSTNFKVLLSMSLCVSLTPPSTAYGLGAHCQPFSKRVSSSGVSSHNLFRGRAGNPPRAIFSKVALANPTRSNLRLQPSLSPSAMHHRWSETMARLASPRKRRSPKCKWSKS